MFILTKIQDLVQIPPHEFYKKSRDSIEDKVNEKYSNKVLQKVGLCICMWDLLKASDGLIGFGTGNVNVNVEFQMIVFRPFRGEVIAARIKQNTPEGIYLTTEFFDNIFVPETMLFEGSFFHPDEKVWVWKTGESEIFFDDGIPVYARIEKELWEDTMQNGPKTSKAATKAPYSIEASMQEHGLGGIDWW